MKPAKVKSAMREELPLAKAAEHLLEECRMVLPGMQALLGFQLIAVFNPVFANRLTTAEQMLHLGAISLIALAVALIMTPAAYHRQTCPMEITNSFISLSTRLLLWSMWPLAAAICIDLYLIARLITDSPAAGASLVAVMATVFTTLWFVLPQRWRARHRHESVGRPRHEPDV